MKYWSKKTQKSKISHLRIFLSFKKISIIRINKNYNGELNVYTSPGPIQFPATITPYHTKDNFSLLALLGFWLLAQHLKNIFSTQNEILRINQLPCLHFQGKKYKTSEKEADYFAWGRAHNVFFCTHHLSLEPLRYINDKSILLTQQICTYAHPSRNTSFYRMEFRNRTDRSTLNPPRQECD